MSSAMERTIEVCRYGHFNKELIDLWKLPIFINKSQNPIYRFTDNSIGWQMRPDTIRVEFGARVQQSIKTYVMQQMELRPFMTLEELIVAVGTRNFSILHINNEQGQTVVTSDDFYVLLESIPILLAGFEELQSRMQSQGVEPKLDNKTAIGL